MEIHIEIERKFIVRELPRRYLECPSKEINQWYISVDPPARVRVENFDDYFLTIKMKMARGVNREYVWEISAALAQKLAGDRIFNRILKTRYAIGNLELDVFCAGPLNGLVILEFERKSDEDTFEMPAGIIAQEVTGDEKFDNHNLAQLDGVPEEWKCKII